MLVSQPIANEWPIKPPFDNRQVLLATSSSQLALSKVGISDPSKINNHLQETTITLDLLSEKNEETRLTRKNKISQLFAMRIAIAKSRYENPLGVFRGAQCWKYSSWSPSWELLARC